MAEEKREGDIHDWLEDDEFAIVVKSDGSFQGVFAPYELEDFDQLPETVLAILAMIYGDQITGILSSKRTMH